MGTGIELNDHILLRFNKEERRAIGLTFLDFSVLIQRTEFGPKSFPLTGLADISDQMNEAHYNSTRQLLSGALDLLSVYS